MKKVMFNRTKKDLFQVGTFNEGTGELIINCPVWQFANAKANQLKLSIVEDEVDQEEGVEVITPSTEPILTSEGQTIPQQTEIPNNAPQPNIPPVQEMVEPPVVQQAPVQAPPVVQQPVQAPVQAPVVQQPPVAQQAPIQAPVQQPVQQPPVQAPVQQQAPPVVQQAPAFNPATEGLNEIQPQANASAASVDKVNIRKALADRSITEDEFVTALSMQGYGQFGNIDAVPDETCKGCVENINIVENAIVAFRNTNK